MKKLCLHFQLFCAKIYLSFNSIFHEHSEVPVSPFCFARKCQSSNGGCTLLSQGAGLEVGSSYLPIGYSLAGLRNRRMLCRYLRSWATLVGHFKAFYPGHIVTETLRALFRCPLGEVPGKLITLRPVRHGCDVGCV